MIGRLTVVAFVLTSPESARLSAQAPVEGLVVDMAVEDRKCVETTSAVCATAGADAATATGIAVPGRVPDLVPDLVRGEDKACH